MKDEFNIRKHFPVIQKRIEKEIHTRLSIIFDEKIVKQIEQKVSKEAIAEYVKPNSDYQSSFGKRHVKLGKLKCQRCLKNLCLKTCHSTQKRLKKKISCDN